ALHAGVAFVAAAVEAMSAFDHADATLAAGAPFLTRPKPALLLRASAHGAFGRAIGNADALDALGSRRGLVLCRVECGVRGHQARNASEPRVMRLDRCDQ